MNFRCFFRWLAFAVLLSVATEHVWAESEPPTKEEIAETAKWFDTLEWPDLRGKPYVEIQRQGLLARSEHARDSRTRGFLLSEDATAFTLLCDGTVWGYAWPYCVRRIAKSDPWRPKMQLARRTLELSTAVDEALADFARPVPERELVRTGYSAIHEIGSDRTAMFFLARCCARQDHADLAAKLDTALLTQRTVGGLGYAPKPGPFRTVVEDELAQALMWQAVSDFGDLSFSRADLQAAFERMARDFPASKYHDAAKAYADQLQAMVTEDEAHAKSTKPLDQMSEEEQVREWIFRLRDQNGHQNGQPGSCQILSWNSMEEPNTPADHLHRLGYAAVPALLEALGDPHLTRSVEYHRDFYFSHYPLTVGHCAGIILASIAGHVYAQSHLAVHHGGEAGNAALRQWWNEVRDQGEEQFLVDGVKSGDIDSIDFAARLLDRNPAAARDALVGALRSGENHWMKAQWIAQLATIHTQTVTEELRKQMKECDGVAGRATAARALLERKDKGAVPAMIDEWRRWQPVTRWPESSLAVPDALIAFLVQCGDPAGVRALAEKFSTLSPTYKESVLGAAAGWRGPQQPDPNVFPPKVEAALEELLIHALDDRTEVFMDSRICDHALSSLAHRWPKRYPYDGDKTRYERDVQIAQARNGWRAAHRLKNLPLPKRVSIPSAAQDPNMVASLQWSGGTALADSPIAVGRSLTADSLVEMMARLHQECPSGMTGVKFSAQRPADGHGFLVEVEWLPGARTGLDKRWNYRLIISADGDSLCDVSHSDGPEKRGDPTSYREEERAASEALAADSGVSLIVTLRSRLSGN